MHIAAPSRRHVGRAVSVASLLVLAALSVACDRPLGRFEYTTLHSESEHAQLRYGVYLPRGWDRRTPLPLVVLLHGAGDDARSADRSPLVEPLDAAIASGQLPPFIMVTPDGQYGFWVNWHDGSHHYRDWVVKEVIPDVSRRFPVLPAPQGLHLVGVSMGAGGGLQLWLHTPQTFASASFLSAPILDEHGTRAFLERFTSRDVIDRVFGPPQRSSGIDPYAALHSDADLRGTRLLFGAASADREGILASNQAFHALLAQRHVSHTMVTFPGRHGWRAWSQVLPHVLCHQMTSPCKLRAPSSTQWTGLQIVQELGMIKRMGE